MTKRQAIKGPPRLAGSARTAKVLALALLTFLAFAYAAYLSEIYDGPKPLYESSGFLIGRDFLQFWVASDLALDGRIADLADVATFEAAYKSKIGPVTLNPEYDKEHSYVWYYPPHSLLIVLPLALLPYLWSYAVWIAATLAAYLLASARRGLRRIEIPILLLAPSTLMNFLIGQNGFLSAALLIGGMRLVERRPWLSGILLGLLSFKPQFGLLVPVALIAGRFWRPFVAASMTVLAMVGASAVIFGIESWTSFLATGLDLQSNLLNRWGRASPDLAISPVMSARNIGLGAVTRNLLYVAVTAFVVWGVFATYRNPRADSELRLPVLLVGVLLASPYGHSYDLTLVSVAVLWCFQHSLRVGFRTGELVLLGLVWMLPIAAGLLNIKGIPPGPPLLIVFYTFLLAKTNGWLPRTPVSSSPVPQSAG